ncbi:MAG: autotransporter outer membrane beta-barrel domain-containing protein [Thermodesulfobacteriota bacterium]|nr:autotransporter outer membrane beta-barrel domain-containing protein [Thermodesulfobacteriota bacterium]
MKKQYLSMAGLVFLAGTLISAQPALCQEDSYYEKHHHDPLDVSSVATAPTTTKTAVTEVARIVSKGIANAVRPNRFSGRVAVNTDESMTGLSAGDSGQNLGVWANAAYTDSEDDDRATRNEADLRTYTLGVDYRFTDKIALGIAFTHEDMDAATYFNDGNMSSNGYTITPFIAMLLNDNISLDLMYGYSNIDIDQERATDIKGTLYAKRNFAQVSANYYLSMDRLNLTGTLGYLYAHEYQESFRETNLNKVDSVTIDLGQIFAGAEVSYSFDALEPYLGIAYENDVQHEETEGIKYDHTGGSANAGVRFLVSDSFSGDLEGRTLFSRGDFDEYSVMLNLRFAL